jgi:hypothetical protein
VHEGDLDPADGDRCTWIGQSVRFSRAATPSMVKPIIEPPTWSGW